MTDAVDFGALKTPDYLGDYTNAFRVGQGMAGGTKMNAFNVNGETDPGRGIAALAPEARAAAARRAEVLAAVGRGLASRPYAERRAIIAHLTPQLVGQGVPAAELVEFDPSDENLAAAVGQASALQAALTTPTEALAPNAMQPERPRQPGE
jgi:hypothetical protein